MAAMLSRYVWANVGRYSRPFVNSRRFASSEVAGGGGGDEFRIPKPDRKDETVELRRARLLYQSRKRGMLENDLLLSTFADKYLHTFTAEQLKQYDFLINEPSNDWDLYYWLTGKNEPPQEFRNEVFEMLQKHTRNELREKRIRQPSIRFA